MITWSTPWEIISMARISGWDYVEVQSDQKILMSGLGSLVEKAWTIIQIGHKGNRQLFQEAQQDIVQRAME